MLNCGDFSAWISVDGSELEQYSVEVSPDGKTTSCWIASKAGKNFSVHWKPSSLYRGGPTGGYLEVDGYQCSGRILDPGARDGATMSAVSTSAFTQRSLCFSCLDLTDDDSYLEDDKSIQKLGQIQITIWQVIVGKHTPLSNPILAIPQDQKVHERTKKAGAHRIKFGGEVPSTSKSVSRRVTKIETTPFATFIFRYNPLEVLKANGIAPAQSAKRSDAIAIANEEPDVKPKRKRVEDDEDEVQIIDKPQGPKGQKGKAKKVKLESLNDRAIFTKGEVIDLT